MTVKDLIEKLNEMDQDAEIVVPGPDEFTEYDADYVYASTRKVGIATPNPREEKIVVIEYMSRGL